MNDNERHMWPSFNERHNKELYRISWTQEYDITSLNELIDEFALEQSDFAEAKELINRIKNLK